MAAAWHNEALVVADHTGGIWVFDGAVVDGTSQNPDLMFRALANPICAAIDNGLLYLVIGSGGGVFEP